MDEPHTITSCDGSMFTVFDLYDCRITVDGVGCVDVADMIINAVRKLEKEANHD